MFKEITIELIDKWIDALSTQYQIVGGYQGLTDASFKPRASKDAPTLEQISFLREAHLNIVHILLELKDMKMQQNVEKAIANKKLNVAAQALGDIAFCKSWTYQNDGFKLVKIALAALKEIKGEK